MQSYKTLEIHRSYISCGNENIAAAFIGPMLKSTKLYKRSVGYFSSSVFNAILDGILALARNGGKIQLIASPKLSEDDVIAMKIGYDNKMKIADQVFSEVFEKEIELMSDSNLQLLASLIASNILDIKIAITKTVGDYHDKFGIMEDFEGNKVAFFGSANSSLNGYKNNYEKIRTARGWINGENENVVDEEREFDILWSNQNSFVDTYDFNSTAEKNCLK